MKTILEPKIYDEKATLSHIENLAFSRTATTPGETEATLYIEESLGADNFKIKYQQFTWTGPRRVLMRIFYVIIFIYLVIYRLLLVIAIYFALKYSFASFRKQSLIQKEESKNLHTTIYAENQEKKRSIIIFCAHYDSFSATPPYRIQTVLFFIFRIIIIPIFFIALAFTVLVYFYEITPSGNDTVIINLIYIITIIEFIIVTLVFLLIYDTKKSTGSIDNASGVSILIELAKLLNKIPPKNVDVIFLFSGAEEWGLVGSRMFCNKYRKEFQETYDLNKSYCINIDMVGSYTGLFNRKGITRKSVNKDLNEIILASAKSQNIPLVSYSKTLSPNSDYRSFRKLKRKTKTKLQVACFHSSKDTKFIHSAKDSPDKCSSEILNGCLEICFDVVRTIDSNNESLEEIR